MSTENLEKYKKLYSKFVEELVHLHNYHESFMFTLAFNKGVLSRRHLKEVVALSKELLKVSRAVTTEAERNKKLEKKAAKEQEKLKRRPVGRPRKTRVNEVKSEGRPRLRSKLD
jgi:hypothetical protein